MEQGEDGTGKPWCCSGQGMGNAGKRPGCPVPELVLLHSHFTGLVVGPGEGGAQHIHPSLAVPVPPQLCCPHSHVPAPSQGCPHPSARRADVPGEGRARPGRAWPPQPRHSLFPGALSLLWKVLKSLIKAVTLRTTLEQPLPSLFCISGMQEMAKQLVFLSCPFSPPSPLPAIRSVILTLLPRLGTRIPLIGGIAGMEGHLHSPVPAHFSPGAPAG